TVISDCSIATISPSFTRTSMTSTSLKSPMSGTFTSILLMSVSLREGASGVMRVGLVGIDAVLADRFRHLLHRDGTVFGERLERRHGHKATIDLEVLAQPVTEVRASETVGAEYLVVAAFRNERPDLIGEQLHVVGGRNDRPGGLLEQRADVGLLLLACRVQQVPAFAIHAVAAQLGETGDAPEVGSDAPVVLEQFGCGHDLAQDGARAEQLNAVLGLLHARLQQIAATDD